MTIFLVSCMCGVLHTTRPTLEETRVLASDHALQHLGTEPGILPLLVIVPIRQFVARSAERRVVH